MISPEDVWKVVGIYELPSIEVSAGSGGGDLQFVVTVLRNSVGLYRPSVAVREAVKVRGAFPSDDEQLDFLAEVLVPDDSFDWMNLREMSEASALDKAIEVINSRLWLSSSR